MTRAPVPFSVTVIVHDGSSVRQTPEGHHISLDVRLGCCLVRERGKVQREKCSSSAAVQCGTNFPLTWLNQLVRLE